MGEDRNWRAIAAGLALLIATGVGGWWLWAATQDENGSDTAQSQKPVAADQTDGTGEVFTQGGWTSIEIPFVATDIIAIDDQLLAVGGADFDMMAFQGGQPRSEFFRSDDAGLTWDQVDDPPAGANALVEYQGEVLAGATGLLAEPGVAVVGRWTGDDWDEIELAIQPLDGDRNVLRLEHARVSLLPHDDVLVAIVVQNYHMDLESLVPPEFQNSDYSILPTPHGLNIFDASIVGQRCVLPMLTQVMREGDQSEEIRDQGCDPDLPSPELVRSVTPADADLGDLGAFGSLIDIFTSDDGATFLPVDLPAEMASGSHNGSVALIRNDEIVVGHAGGTWSSPDGRTWKPGDELLQAGAWNNGRLAIDWNGGPFLSMPDHPEVNPVLASDLINLPRDHHVEFWGEPPGPAAVVGAVEQWNKGDQWLTQLHLVFAEDGRWLVESDPLLLGSDSLVTAAAELGDEYIIGLVENAGFFGRQFDAGAPVSRLLIGRPAG